MMGGVPGKSESLPSARNRSRMSSVGSDYDLSFVSLVYISSHTSAITFSRESRHEQCPWGKT